MDTERAGADVSDMGSRENGVLMQRDSGLPSGGRGATFGSGGILYVF